MRPAAPSSVIVAFTAAAIHRCNYPAHSHILYHSPQLRTTTTHQTTVAAFFIFCQPHRCWLSMPSPPSVAHSPYSSDHRRYFLYLLPDTSLLVVGATTYSRSPPLFLPIVALAASTTPSPSAFLYR
ncbi:hypothetical protein B296_00007857 [Ensete ventricosum]|uniref:Uncharacterized protein n=1 Tax=Ensete ventricosum TaxID=4639 RepID=A0A426YHZ5_ENSVE|nr:hypothetical protein B296_00007857 [Ensete ventricosum]